MTIALILAGHSYKITPAAAGFNYSIRGHALSIGETFVADEGTQSNDALKLGMMRGHIVEEFTQALAGDRDARMTELRQAMGVYASSHSCNGAQAILTYDTIQTKELLGNDDALYGIVITQPYIKFTAVTTLAGTTLNKTAPVKFQATQNGVNTSTRVAATGGASPYNISRSGMTGIASGDVLGFYAVDDTDGSRLSTTVTKYAIYEAPAVAGTPVRGSTSVTGTSTAPNGAIVTLYQNNTAIKTATVAGGAGAWTASSIGGSVIVATGSLTAVVAAGDLQASVASAAVIAKYTAPTVEAVIHDTATTVNVTTSPAVADGVTITVYRNGVSAGTGLVAGGAGACAVTTTAVALGETITAKTGTGAAQSAASTGVVVVA